jgi:putative membrane protein
MRVLAWLVGLPLTIAVVLFAVSNRQSITIGFWPFADGIEAPAYLIGLVPMALGLLIGAGLAGIGTVHARFRHRSATRTIRAMEKRLAELMARTPKITGPDAGKPNNAGPGGNAPFS